MVNTLSWAQDQFGESLCIGLVLRYKDQYLYWRMNEWMLAERSHSEVWTCIGLVYRSTPGINIGMNNDIKYHTSLVSKLLIFLPISLYPHNKYWFFCWILVHFFKYQYNTQYQAFALLFHLVSISSGMHTSVWKIPLNTCFLFPWRLRFCEFLELPKEEVAALFVSIVLRFVWWGYEHFSCWFCFVFLKLQSRLENPENDVELGYLNDDKKVPLEILGIGLVKWDPKWESMNCNTHKH